MQFLMKLACGGRPKVKPKFGILETKIFEGMQNSPLTWGNY